MLVKDVATSRKQASLLTMMGAEKTCVVGRLSNMYWVPRTLFESNAALMSKCIITPKSLVPSADPPPPWSVAQVYEEYVGVPPGLGFAAFGQPAKRFNNPGNKIPRDRLTLNSKYAPRDYQSKAVSKIITALHKGLFPRALLCASCGLGKTLMGLLVARSLGYQTAIVVHRGELMTQWKDRINDALPNASVGVVQGKTRELDRDFVIIMMQTLMRMRSTPLILFQARFGLVLWDECHHVPAQSFSKCVSAFGGMHVGLTATPSRSDGMTWLLHACLGPTIVNLKRTVVDDDKRVQVRTVDFVPERDDGLWAAAAKLARRSRFFLSDRARFMSKLTEHPTRNALIVEAVSKMVLDEGRRVIVLTERRKHVDTLVYMLLDLHGLDSALLVGGAKPKSKSKSKKRKRGVEPPVSAVDPCEPERLSDALAAPPISIGTYAFASEGLDDKSKDTLVFATPTTNKTWLQQCVGRIMRGFSSNRPVVLDVTDECVRSMTKRRMEWYEGQKYTLPPEWSAAIATRRPNPWLVAKK